MGWFSRNEGDEMIFLQIRIFLSHQKLSQSFLLKKIKINLGLLATAAQIRCQNFC